MDTVQVKLLNCGQFDQSHFPNGCPKLKLFTHEDVKIGWRYQNIVCNSSQQKMDQLFGNKEKHVVLKYPELAKKSEAELAMGQHNILNYIQNTCPASQYVRMSIFAQLGQKSLHTLPNGGIFLILYFRWYEWVELFEIVIKSVQEDQLTQTMIENPLQENTLMHSTAIVRSGIKSKIWGLMNPLVVGHLILNECPCLRYPKVWTNSAIKTDAVYRQILLDKHNFKENHLYLIVKRIMVLFLVSWPQVLQDLFKDDWSWVNCAYFLNVAIDMDLGRWERLPPALSNDIKYKIMHPSWEACTDTVYNPPWVVMYMLLACLIVPPQLNIDFFKYINRHRSVVECKYLVHIIEYAVNKLSWSDIFTMPNLKYRAYPNGKVLGVKAQISIGFPNKHYYKEYVGEDRIQPQHEITILHLMQNLAKTNNTPKNTALQPPIISRASIKNSTIKNTRLLSLYDNGELYWYNKLTGCWYYCEHNITKTSNKDTMMHPWGQMHNPPEVKVWKLENLHNIIKHNMDDSTSTMLEYMEMPQREVEITPVISVNGLTFKNIWMREIRMLKQVPSDNTTLEEFVLLVTSQDAPAIRKAKMICQIENQLNFLFYIFIQYPCTDCFVLFVFCCQIQEAIEQQTQVVMKYTTKVESEECKMEKFHGIDDKFSELKTHKERNNLSNYSNIRFGLMQIRKILLDMTEMGTKYFNAGSDDDKSGLKVVNDIISKQFNEVFDIVIDNNMVFDLKIFLQKHIQKQDKQIEFDQKFSENFGRKTKKANKNTSINCHDLYDYIMFKWNQMNTRRANIDSGIFVNFANLCTIMDEVLHMIKLINVIEDHYKISNDKI